MSVNNFVSMAVDMKVAQTAQQVQVEVLRKALDIQEQTATQLIQAVPQPKPAANPPNLGQNVDAYA